MRKHLFLFVPAAMAIGLFSGMPESGSTPSPAISCSEVAAGAVAGRLDPGRCTYNDIPLRGRVKVVESFPDFTVRVVESFPDIDVQWVSSFPDRCGQWQFVDEFPDFTIRYVESFPDVKVRFVTSFPGMK